MPEVSFQTLNLPTYYFALAAGPAEEIGQPQEALHQESRQGFQLREQPLEQPDTGWQTSDSAGKQNAEFGRRDYKPQSNGTFASLLSFAQMYYNPAYREHSDERLVSLTLLLRAHWVLLKHIQQVLVGESCEELPCSILNEGSDCAEDWLEDLTGQFSTGKTACKTSNQFRVNIYQGQYTKTVLPIA